MKSKELQELKSFLSNSKELAMQITASILTNEYGISNLNQVLQYLQLQ